MNPIARVIVNRFKEPSSWAGFSSFAALLGITSPLYGAIALTGSGICALVAFLLPENKDAANG